jgi:hypothetical protein
LPYYFSKIHQDIINQMPETVQFLDYSGPVDYNKIDHLLKTLKKNKEFLNLHNTTGKRVYAILVESLENIAKHSVRKPPQNIKKEPHISVGKQNDKVIIKAGNLIQEEKRDKLVKKLDHINSLNEYDLNSLYENKINLDLHPEANGAGLGFMLMKLKSGNDVEYRFSPVNNDLTYFELKISVNKYIMKKLIIDQTSNSPKVILDPERNRFEISGESRPPDVANFYEGILDWLDDYSVNLVKSQGSKDPVVFNFDLEYFNSSSAKYILDFCKQLACIRSKGNDIAIKWHHEEDDMDMLEVGREMSRMAKLPFEYVRKDIK